MSAPSARRKKVIMDNTNDENTTNSVTLTFTHKNVLDHIISFGYKYIKNIPKTIALFCSLWAVIEILTSGDDTSKIKVFLLPYLVLTTVISLCITVRDYINDIPEELKEENKAIKKAYVLRRIGWEYSIIYEMLEARIQSLQNVFERIKNSTEYIPPAFISSEDYIDFIKLQPIKLLRLVKAAKDTCVFSIPARITSKDEIKENGFKNIKNEIDNLTELYKQTIIFEKDILSIIPDEKYRELHELMSGWTNPIRDGIDQYCLNMKYLSRITKKQIKREKLVEANIVFNPPENLDYFNLELNRLISEET